LFSEKMPRRRSGGPAREKKKGSIARSKVPARKKERGEKKKRSYGSEREPSIAAVQNAGRATVTKGRGLQRVRGEKTYRGKRERRRKKKGTQFCEGERKFPVPNRKKGGKGGRGRKKSGSLPP